MTELEKIKITDELMQAITQTDYWVSVQKHDPMIKQADKQLEKLLEKLPKHLRDLLVDAINDAVCCYCDAAILYGIYTAHALQYGAGHQTEVSQYLIERVQKGRQSA